jgi:ketosteroid isomerase-like protein
MAVIIEDRCIDGIIQTTKEERANIEAVRQIYRAFLAGDIDHVLSRMAPDIRVTGSTNKIADRAVYARDFHGAAEVANGFDLFRNAVPYHEASAPLRISAKGNKVLAIGQDVRSTQSSPEMIETRWSMLWTLEGGLVTQLRVVENSVEAL